VATLKELRRRFSGNDGLPFSEVLTESNIQGVLDDHATAFRDRVFSPQVTIWGFLSQVLSEDQSCRDAVSRIVAHRATSGEEVCSPNTAAYCKARSRLSQEVLSALASRTAADLESSAKDEWKWCGRNVFIIDGSSVSMPDTAPNQEAYPQPPSQKPGVGFPLARIAVLLSLATGACHDLAIAPYRGKGTGETSLFRKMYPTLKRGDVVVGDALFDDYFIACELRQRGIDIVARAQYLRQSAKMKERCGPHDEVLVWTRPGRPRGMTTEQYKQYPSQLEMRQVSVDARDKNNRVKQFKVITSILDMHISCDDVSGLFERRWDGEVDIRSIKDTMHMGILRCKTPEMVHKEIWTHLLAYNLLRSVMLIAANEHDLEPRDISFKGAKQTVTAFAPKLAAVTPQRRGALIAVMVANIAHHRVRKRPGRWEPRAIKRRPHRHDRLTQPRSVAKEPQNRQRWH
jgi:hypothetical protein